MVVLKSTQKVMVGSRMTPDLKEVLEAEAAERGVSFSAYLETLVLNRAHNSADVEKLKEKIFELESTVAELREQKVKMEGFNNSFPDDTALLSKELMEKGIENRILKQERVELVAKLNQALKERDISMKIQGKPIPHWISDDGYHLLVQSINSLKKLYPHYTHEELLLSSLGLIEFNEAKPIFMIDTLDKFWKKKSNFLTLIKQKGGQQ